MVSTTFYKISKIALINVFLIVFLFLLFEGAVSLYFAYRDASQEIAKEPELLERIHTEYDPLLGWINKANVSIENIYGPNINFKTNTQRFRNDADFAQTVPTDKIRIICSGDSFTLGYGVNNQQSWCNQLEIIDKRVQSVNMGQGGYGIGQSYLWYKRDGMKLDHNVHIFAFITPDFGRMMSNLLTGVPKPRLHLENGKIAVKNVPVARQSLHRAFKYLRQVNVVKLASEIGAYTLPDIKNAPNFQVGDMTSLAGAVFADLEKLSNQKNRTLMLVYLPKIDEYRGTRHDWIQGFVQKEAEKRGIHFLNVVTELKRLPPIEVQKFYFHEDINGIYGSKGHMTAAGNTFVAQKIHEALIRTKAIPAE